MQQPSEDIPDNHAALARTPEWQSARKMAWHQVKLDALGGDLEFEGLGTLFARHCEETQVGFELGFEQEEWKNGEVDVVVFGGIRRGSYEQNGNLVQPWRNAVEQLVLLLGTDYGEYVFQSLSPAQRIVVLQYAFAKRLDDQYARFQEVQGPAEALDEWLAYSGELTEAYRAAIARILPLS